MNFDYPTILFFFVLTNVFNIALFTYQYFFHHKKWYLSVFIVGILFQTIALILIGNRNNLTFFYTVQLSNFFLISSFALTTFGLISFDGKIRKKTLWLFIISFLLFYISFLLLAKNDILRIVIQIIACTFFYGTGVINLFLNKNKYKFSIIISFALLVYVVFQIYRASILYQIDQPYNFLEGSNIDNWYLIISLFIVSTLRIGFIMLLKEINEYTIHLKNQKIQEDKLKLEELIKTKDKLFSIIAHDLRSPFNNILGFSELLSKSLKNFEITKSEKYLRIIDSSAQNTLILLDNLLNWAKSQTGQIKFNPKKHLLLPIVTEISDLLNSFALAKNISLIQNKAKDIEVYADVDMLKTILRNLITNAIKFTNPGGKITIESKSTQNMVEISIADNGVGMDKETINKLFRIESYETSIGTANEKGSGLGLILCKELVEKQKGKIWVESEIGNGSVFKFSLPLNKSS